jgi:quinolinate synthase
MIWQTDIPDHYDEMPESAIADAIELRRGQLGSDLLILGHHYQQEAVIRHVDLTGDSLRLSRLAAEEAPRRGVRYIVFCGVNFMAQTADLLTDERVAVILPHLAAACPMAAMADVDDVVEAWEAIGRAAGGRRVVPVVYVNSGADAKAFAGARGGACCTSGNAAGVLRWALDGGECGNAGGDALVLFIPDEHLGRNTASRLGLRAEVGETAGRGCSDTVTWNPRMPSGGLTPRQIRAARVILWPGHCYVHVRFRPEDVRAARVSAGGAEGVRVIVHPECRKEVVDLADEAGSTERIIRAVDGSPDGSRWVVGTEVNLVRRLAARHAARGVAVGMLGGRACMCAQMFRIDSRHLLWMLDNLARGTVVNQVRVDQAARAPARAAVDRMLAVAAT